MTFKILKLASYIFSKFVETPNQNYLGYVQINYERKKNTD